MLQTATKINSAVMLTVRKGTDEVSRRLTEAAHEAAEALYAALGTTSLEQSVRDGLSQLVSSLRRVARSQIYVSAAKFPELTNTLFRLKSAATSSMHRQSDVETLIASADAVVADLQPYLIATAAITDVVDLLEVEQSETIKRVSERISAILADAEKRADELLKTIMARGDDAVAIIRKSKTDALLVDAAAQLDAAQHRLRLQVAGWAILAGLLTSSFFVFAGYLLTTQEDLLTRHSNWTWQLLYYASLRLVILTAIAGVGAFCLRMLTAHIRLLHENGHRSRITRSMPGYLEVAPVEHRAALLSQIISALILSEAASLEDVKIDDANTIARIVEQVSQKK